MIDEVYLLWESYLIDELLEIGVLKREERGYSFKFGKDVVKAEACGCLLPFAYTEEPLHFECLPHFFAQRMLGRSTLDKLGVTYNSKDELSMLTAYNNGAKNSDNFFVVTKEAYKSLEGNADKIKM